MKKHSKFWNVALVTVALMLILPAALASAAPPLAALGAATVDGLIGEWDLTNDWFGDLYRSGVSSKDELGDLYLRYDCENGILYALVMSAFPVQEDTSEAWIAISPTQSFSDKVSFLEFAWVEDAGGTVVGWEASFSLAEQQVPAYNLFVHTNVYEGGEWQTAGSDWILLEIFCPPTPTAVILGQFGAAAEADQIRLSWETGVELDNLGFNVYRAEWQGGPRVKLNESLIASQAPGGVAGGSYEYVDGTVAPGMTYYYWLETIGTDNTAVEYGPVSATALRSFRTLRLTRIRLAPTGLNLFVGR